MTKLRNLISWLRKITVVWHGIQSTAYVFLWSNAQKGLVDMRYDIQKDVHKSSMQSQIVACTVVYHALLLCFLLILLRWIHYVCTHIPGHFIIAKRGHFHSAHTNLRWLVYLISLLCAILFYRSSSSSKLFHWALYLQYLYILRYW